ncbi:hypothetical protein H8356DRAFT_1345110 [Neocallimastix lanati (nom. inval.)]|nr:hypothetical protein H8356DRAFT_1345110 [Neocallimastix sp. JGI-2020a]
MLTKIILLSITIVQIVLLEKRAKLFEIMDTEVHSLRVVISDDQFISLKLSMQSEKMSMTDHVGPNIKKSINQAHAKVTTYNNN